MPETLPLHWTILAVDAARFTDPARSPVHHADMHTAIHDLVRQAFEASGIDFESCHVEDRGDGLFALIPASIPKGLLADRFSGRLVACLRRHNATRSPNAALRLRVAMHAGEVRLDTTGAVGPAANLTFRILEAQEAKQALDRSKDVLAIIASDWFYQEVILADPGANPDRYRQIPVEVKQTKCTAWLCLPESPLVPEILPRTDLDQVQKLLIGLTKDDVPDLLTLMRRATGPTTPAPGKLTDAWAAFQHLAEFNSGSDGLPAALQFVRMLTQRQDTARGELSDWLARQLRAYGRTSPAEIRREEASGATQIELRLHLLIAVLPDAIDTDRFLLTSWRQDDPNEWPPPRGETKEVALTDLEHEVDKLITESERAWSAYGGSAALEFLLPRSLLCLPVQRWHKYSGSRPLFLDYPVVVRSLDRMEATELHRPWRRRWTTMRRSRSSAGVHYCQPADLGNPNRVDALLSSPEWTLVVLTCAPPAAPSASTAQDELTAALRAGIPALIWHPEISADGLRDIVTWLVEGDGMIDLPARTMATRLAALQKSALPFDVALAEGIVVLWDDPDRLVVFDRPAS